MNLNNINFKQIVLLIFITLLIYTGMQNISVIFFGILYLLNISFPFILGACLAFVINIPMNFFELRLFCRLKNNKVTEKLKRPLSLILSFLIIIAVIAFVIMMLIPQLTKTFVSIGKTIQIAIPKFINFINHHFDKTTLSSMVNEKLSEIDVNNIIDTISKFIKSSSQSKILSTTMNAAKSFVSSVVNIIIAIIFAIYILLQKEKLNSQINKVLKAFFNDKVYNRIYKICHISYISFKNFITGQCFEAIILGSMFFVTMLIIRLPYALLVSILIAFFALIPMVGAFIGFILSFLLILMVSPIKSIEFIVLFIILQQIEGNLIYPKVVGNSVGLPSIWVLVAVTLGGNIFGVAGILLFIPISSVMYSLFREYINQKLIKKNSL